MTGTDGSMNKQIKDTLRMFKFKTSQDKSMKITNYMYDIYLSFLNKLSTFCKKW